MTTRPETPAGRPKLDPKDLPLGYEIGGKYRVVKRLSAGGMGTVYVVEPDGGLDKRALKILYGEALSDKTARARLMAEARVRGRLPMESPARPHLADVLEDGFDQELHAPYLVMEYLPGATLAQRGRLGAREVAALAEQLAAVLTEVHRLKIVHCDLKPENLMLAKQTTSVRLVVLDFGIARILRERGTALGVGDGAMWGTIAWAAPEQGLQSEPITEQTDIWAFGLIVFYALVGRTFWCTELRTERDELALRREIETRPYGRASERARGCGVELPEAFDEWFARSVARNPRERFESARAAMDALRPILDGMPGDEPAPPPDVAPRGESDDEAPPEDVNPFVRSGEPGRLTNVLRAMPDSDPGIELLPLLDQLATKLEALGGRRADLRPLSPDVVTLRSGVADLPGVKGGVGTSRLDVLPDTYAAPEVLLDTDAPRSAEAAAAADVWSFGLIAFRWLAGRAYWEVGDRGELIERLSNVRASDRPLDGVRRAKEYGVEEKIPRHFFDWFQRCTHPEPSRRYRTPRAAVDGLRAVTPTVPAPPPVAPPPPVPVRPPPEGGAMRGRLKRLLGAAKALRAAITSRRRLWLALSVGVVLGAAVFVAYRHARSPPPPVAQWVSAVERVNPFVVVPGAPFEVHAHEVSRSEYERHARAASLPLPEVAPDESPGAPARFVTWAEADRYCRAIGARLPTFDEWARARGDGWSQRLARLIRHPILRPVGSVTDDSARDGGPFDLLTNVSEWVADVRAEHPRTHRIAGASFAMSLPAATSMVGQGRWVTDEARPTWPGRSPEVGFRCVRERSGR